MKMKLNAALALVLVHGDRIHNPPLSPEDAETLRIACKIVRNRAADILRQHRRPSPPKEAA